MEITIIIVESKAEVLRGKLPLGSGRKDVQDIF